MESDVLLDRRLAFAFLRFTLGLNLLMHGAVRLPILSAFVAGLVKEFAKTPLPVVVVKAFAYSLPFEEGLVGLFVPVFGATRKGTQPGTTMLDAKSRWRLRTFLRCRSRCSPPASPQNSVPQW
jgi:hypothetical protein